MSERSDSDRRSFLASVGAVVLSAGCSTVSTDVESPETPTTRARTTDPSPTSTDTETATETETDTETETATPEPESEPDLPGGESLADLAAFDDAWTVESGRAGVPWNEYGDLPAVAMSSDGDSRARITRKFDRPRDLSEWDLSVAAQLHSTGKGLFQLHLTLVDAHGERSRLSGSIQSTATGRWVRLDAGVREGTGIDASAVTELRSSTGPATPSRCSASRTSDDTPPPSGGT